MEEQWQGQVVIDRPVQQVYTYLADFPRHAEWAQTLEKLDLKNPGSASGVGAEYLTHERQAFHADRRQMEPIRRGMRANTYCYVDELVPNRRIAWHSHPVPIRMGTRARIAFDFAPEGDGRTRLTQTIRMRQPTLLYRAFALVAGLSPEKMDAQWTASLENIKAVMESQPAAELVTAGAA